MNFGLTDEQEMVVNTVRTFVENEIYPLEKEVEKTGLVPDEIGQEIKNKVLKLFLLMMVVLILLGLSLKIYVYHQKKQKEFSS